MDQIVDVAQMLQKAAAGVGAEWSVLPAGQAGDATHRITRGGVVVDVEVIQDDSQGEGFVLARSGSDDFAYADFPVSGVEMADTAPILPALVNAFLAPQADAEFGPHSGVDVLDSHLGRLHRQVRLDRRASVYEWPSDMIAPGWSVEVTRADETVTAVALSYQTKSPGQGVVADPPVQVVRLTKVGPNVLEVLMQGMY